MLRHVGPQLGSQVGPKMELTGPSSAQVRHKLGPRGLLFFWLFLRRRPSLTPVGFGLAKDDSKPNGMEQWQSWICDPATLKKIEHIPSWDSPFLADSSLRKCPKSMHDDDSRVVSRVSHVVEIKGKPLGHRCGVVSYQIWGLPLDLQK